jgi:hypothetical protein
MNDQASSLEKKYMNTNKRKATTRTTMRKIFDAYEYRPLMNERRVISMKVFQKVRDERVDHVPSAVSMDPFQGI